ncbi:MAG: NADH-quinone oxidoreductase subunit J [candidate division Zixibacteria bacterium]|nr:NADH-quinone oxidoreductase subunit J [candidate division Zixibacteria bacterium]
MESAVLPYLFYLFAFVIIVSALLVVLLRNIFHCALMLILCLFAVAGLYVLLQADFVAAVQVLLYVGAVAVLMIFAIMLTSRVFGVDLKQQNEQVPLALIVSIVFVAAAFYGLGKTVWDIKDASVPADSTMSLGKLLMTTYVMPFEIVSVVLLAALIGAIVIARRN